MRPYTASGGVTSNLKSQIAISRGSLTREVIQTVIDAGPDGISSRGVTDILYAFDVPGTPEAIRSILSRARYAGALTYDGVYRVK